MPSQTICAYQEDASVFCGSGASIMQSQSQIPNLSHIPECNSGHGDATAATAMQSGHGDAKPVESHSAAIVNGNSSRLGGYWIGSPSFELQYSVFESVAEFIQSVQDGLGLLYATHLICQVFCLDQI